MYPRLFLTYNGNCEEAIELYKKAFNANVTGMMRFADAPPNPNMPPIAEEQKNLVVQATLDFGGAYIRMSDSMVTGTPGDIFAIALECTVDEAQKAFEVLSETGKVVMPMGATFFSPAFGIVEDKFGLRWQIAGGVSAPPGK